VFHGAYWTSNAWLQQYGYFCIIAVSYQQSAFSLPLDVTQPFTALKEEKGKATDKHG